MDRCRLGLGARTPDQQDDIDDEQRKRAVADQLEDVWLHP